MIRRALAIWTLLMIAGNVAGAGEHPATRAATLPPAYRRLWEDPAIAERITRDIERYRKGDAVITVLGADGKPLAGATLEIRQTAHAFLFGCNLFVLGQLATPELNRRYEAAFTNLFNFATIPFYWRDLEPQEDRPRYVEGSPDIWRRPPPDRLVKWCLAHGITPKGHALMYVKSMFMPDWTARRDAEVLRRQGAAHMAEIAERYARDIPIWDAVNEEIPRQRHPEDWPAVPDDYLAWCFQEADRLFPKQSRLLINDGTNEVHDAPEIYESMARRLVQQGVRLDGLGLQFHVYNRAAMLKGTSLPPRQLRDVYERLGRLGLPLYITEITVPGSGDDGAELQAAIVARLYPLWFSTPAMAGITWWNLGDGTAFQDENRARGGLLDEAMNPKPVYRELDRLINRQWRTSLTLTTSAEGKAAFRGFHGRYMVRVISGDAERQFPFELPTGAGTTSATISLR